MDLVFLLLIFFVLTSTMAREQALQVRRPRAATAEAVASPPVVVTITAAGTLHLGAQAVSLGALTERVQAALARDQERQVLVAADEEARAGLVVAVMDACRVAGALDVLLATRLPGENP